MFFIKQEAFSKAKVMERERSSIDENDEYTKSLLLTDILALLIKSLKDFILTKVQKPKSLIAEKHGQDLIKEGETVLIYGKYTPFKNIVRSAAEKITFKLIFLDNYSDKHCYRLRSQKRSGFSAKPQNRSNRRLFEQHKRHYSSSRQSVRKGQVHVIERQLVGHGWHWFISLHNKTVP